jgi:transcriptional regulator with XRE-family HTH domain
MQVLAEKVGVTRARIGAWEGGTGFPDLQNLIVLCQVLRASADYLLGLDLAMATIPEGEILKTSPATDYVHRAAKDETRETIRVHDLSGPEDDPERGSLWATKADLRKLLDEWDSFRADFQETIDANRRAQESKDTAAAQASRKEPPKPSRRGSRDQKAR